MKISAFSAVLLSLATLSAAWPWPEAHFDGVKAVEDVGALLFKRQNTDSSSVASTSATQKGSTTTQSASGGKSTDSASKTTSGKTSTGTHSGTDSESGSAAATTAAPTGGSDNSNSSSATTEYDPRLPAGGVSMITPAVSSGAQYYKIGDWVTFAWNYTSLSATPSAIDVFASCAANQALYTLALNQSVSEIGKVLWDTGDYQATATVPLLTNTYTLIIYPADSSISATPKAGYLAVQQTYTFGMYTPQPYTPWSSFQCPTCSGAMTAMERQTWYCVGAMAAITVLSFSWFATGVFGVL